MTMEEFARAQGWDEDHEELLDREMPGWRAMRPADFPQRASRVFHSMLSEAQSLQALVKRLEAE